MPNKDNTTLLIIGAVAVVGYFAFKKGLLSAPAPAPPTSNLNQIRAAIPPPGGLQQIPGVASELPDLPDIGIIAPALDPTGAQVTLF
jgi:hypothetical protein